ncbi:hypothetical protein [Halocatena marina]|uniref:hypothetical protein n=1 Tax=Halocatena marina TaxID=2934937 RepID=UPI0020105016|nr:hypothetical protein [Halocatena marina]
MNLPDVRWLHSVYQGRDVIALQSSIGLQDEIAEFLVSICVLAFALILLGAISRFVVYPGTDHLLSSLGVDGRQRRAVLRLTKSVLTILVVSIAFTLVGMEALIVPILFLLAVFTIGYLFREPLTDLILLDERYRDDR